MSESDPRSWTDHLSGRERVRRVVEVLDGPTTVKEIADRADVARTTADDELERLSSDDWVTETATEGTKAYDLNPVRLLFDELTDLIEDNSREDLERTLADLTADREDLVEEYDAESLSALREQFVEEELSAAELQDRRNVISTWEALDTEISLVENALHLYDDVVELSSPSGDDPSTLEV